MTEYQAFVLAKNEAANIGRSIKNLHALGLEVTVLDSGSTDSTVRIVAELGARVRPYDYKNHCKAYNDITSARSERTGCIVVDADVMISRELWNQAESMFESGANVVSAPVAMMIGGRELRHASLYPPKPFLFRGGAEYFRPLGHGEVLKEQVEARETTATLVHDDRKPFERRLATQQKYARQLAARVRDGEARPVDWLRLNSPLTVGLILPYILLARLGILDGFAGLQYAAERLIAEAIIWREGMREKLDEGSLAEPVDRLDSD